jgi:hypothetical protein
VWFAISIVPYSSAFGRHVGNKRLEAASNNLRSQRVVLRGVIPLNWRRLLVSGESTIAQLHDVLPITGCSEKRITAQTKYDCLVTLTNIPRNHWGLAAFNLHITFIRQ